MKIQQLGTVITEVPGLSSIRIEPSATSEHGVHILLDWSEVDRQSFGLDGARELHAALTSAITSAEAMATNESGILRTWTGPVMATEQAPRDVTRVSALGGLFRLNSHGRWDSQTTKGATWAYLLNNHGPVHEHDGAE